MNHSLNLKEIERRAYRSTWQDGLWDIYAGLVVICLSLFMARIATGTNPVQVVFFILALVLANLLYRAGKKYITLPRLGQVKFGAIRKRRKKTLAIIMGLIIALQAGIVGLTMTAWAIPGLAGSIGAVAWNLDRENLLVSVLAALFVGPSMALMAYYNDFSRGYYIAVLLSLAVFLLVRFNQPYIPTLLGLLILLPGLALLLRFLKSHPLPPQEAPHA